MEIAIFFVGLIFATLAGFLFWDNSLFRLHANKGWGRIIAFRTIMEKQGKTRLLPIVSYVHEGKKHLQTSPQKRNLLHKTLGDQIAIDIPYKDLNHARLKVGLSIAFSGLFLLAGISCMVAFFAIFEPGTYSIGLAVFVTIVLSYQVTTLFHQDDDQQALPQHKQKNIFSQYTFQPQKHLWAIVLGIMLSTLSTITGAYLSIEKWQFMQQAATTTGIVTAHDRHIGSPIVSFTPIQAPYPVTFMDKANTSPLDIGTHVAVLYLPSKPQQAIINHGFSTWAGASFFMLFSIIITIGSAILFKRALSSVEV